jgi:hypothetical protein
LRRCNSSDVARLDLEPGRLDDLRGELGEDLIEAAVRVGELGGFLRCDGQIDPAEPTEERGEEALAQQVERGGPVLLAGDRELVEVTARLAVGKDERGRELRRTGIDGTAGLPRQCSAIVVAVRRLRGIDAGTLCADQSHELVPCRA